MSDPFDFSDFGAPRAPAGPPPAEPAWSAAPQPRTPDTVPHNGFDPFAAAAPAPVAPRDAFGGEAAAGIAAPGLTVARPPLELFGPAAALAVAGMVVAAVWGSALPAAAAGWLLAGPAAIGVLAFYTRVDIRRRTAAVYSAPHRTAALYWAVVALCMVGIGVGAWQLALCAGRW